MIGFGDILWLSHAHPLLAALASLVILATLLYLTGAVRYIPNTRVGVVEKLWSRQGSVPSGLIALNGEAGFQPHVLRGGLHFMMPLQYRVHIMPLVTIPQGKIGYVFARDGQPLPPTQTLAVARCGRPTSRTPRAFLRSGGQRGPQRTILREGTYAINLAQFVVITDDGVYCLPLQASEDDAAHRHGRADRRRATASSRW